MTTATPTIRVGFASLQRNAESFAAGTAPTAFRILAAGRNDTDQGPLVFTPDSARSVMAAFAGRGNPLVIYYEHEDMLPLDKQGGTPHKGACAAPSANLAIRGADTEPECWAQDVAWTAEAQRQIKTGERRQISPVAAFNKETREVLAILNVSLCSEGATHFGTLLASKGGLRPMDDIIDKITEAIEAGDFETAESLIQQAEAGGDEGMARMAKMARAAMKASKPAPAAAPPPPPAADATAATARLAASRSALAAATTSVAAFDRAVVEMTAATKRAEAAAQRSDRATVITLIAANRDAFDVVDERQHMGAADPVATERHIASFTRKAKAGVIVLSKAGGATETAAKEGEKKPNPADPLSQLDEKDKQMIESFNRGKPAEKHISAADYLASKNQQSGRAPAQNAAGGRA